MASSNDIVDDFENSFQACLAAVTNPDYFYVRDLEDVHTGVGQTIQRFLDVAKQMESFFIQKRLVLSAQKSEQMVMDDNTELKNELARKEQLLQKYNEQIHYWQNLLNETANATGQQPQPQPSPRGGTQQGMPTQNQQSMPMGGAAQGLPGPLAYMERATYNNDMPDPRQ
ncbi:mediator of RNA polymerase II transcription subunit 28-like [Dermacentor andersoni]|uniref:mediator of RNA polymerase II transcription subunit 28-like n=1 Tax=Dermacentor andersoni TaxID=34620 RepID=UPI002417BAD5|nr:mediator of RNA polymerase II transcription subunit 28-like [Dermacentor andersoni]